MEIDYLFDLIEENKIEDKFDKLIVEKILEAERDWIHPIDDLSDFISQLEEEIGGDTTKENLDKLLKKYSKNGFKNSAWNSESISYLLEIFNWTGYGSLKFVFENLTQKLNTIEKVTKVETFKKKGFPILNLYDTYFEIKAIDHWEFRRFNYSEIKEVTLVNPNSGMWALLYLSMNWYTRILSKNDPFKLIVLKKNGGDWEYQVSNNQSSEFSRILKKINNRSATNTENKS